MHILHKGTNVLKFILLGEKCGKCHILLVHNQVMKKPHQMEYLGHCIHKSGWPKYYNFVRHFNACLGTHAHTLLESLCKRFTDHQYNKLLCKVLQDI